MDVASIPLLHRITVVMIELLVFRNGKVSTSVDWRNFVSNSCDNIFELEMH